MGEKRSQLIIKRHFQQSMILEVLLVMFILVNVIVIAGYFLIDSIADVQQLKRNLAFTVAGLEIAGFAIFYKLNLRASHRIAGPVFVIERSLKSIAAGDLGFSMTLRQGDQFHEVKEQMNETITTLKERIAKSQQLVLQLKEQGADQALLDELEATLGYFRTQAAAATSHDGMDTDAGGQGE